MSGVDLAVYEGDPGPWWGVRPRQKHLRPAPAGAAPPTQGQVFFDGQDLAALPPARLRALRRQMQLVFQDTAAALNPRWTVGQSLAEPLRIHNLCPRGNTPPGGGPADPGGPGPGPAGPVPPPAFRGPAAAGWAWPRPWPCPPRLVVCDEPVSALDVSVQAQMLNLLADLQRAQGLTYVLISHDLGVVRHSADRVCVMFLGRVCEVGPTQALFSAPGTPTPSSCWTPSPAGTPPAGGRAAPLAGGDSLPVHPLRGCRFHDRCPYAQDICAQTVPPLTGAGTTRQPATSP